MSRVLFGNHMVPENPIKSHFVMKQISTTSLVKCKQKDVEKLFREENFDFFEIWLPISEISRWKAFSWRSPRFKVTQLPNFGIIESKLHQKLPKSKIEHGNARSISTDVGDGQLYRWWWAFFALRSSHIETPGWCRGQPKERHTTFEHNFGLVKGISRGEINHRHFDEGSNREWDLWKGGRVEESSPEKCPEEHD